MRSGSGGLSISLLSPNNESPSEGRFRVSSYAPSGDRGEVTLVVDADSGADPGEENGALSTSSGGGGTLGRFGTARSVVEPLFQ